MQDPMIKIYRKQDILSRNCSELIGICKGIIADHRVCHEEAEFLYNWLSANEGAASIYPGNIITSRLAGMLNDGVFDQDECKEILFLLQDMTGERGQHGWGGESTSLGLDNPMPEMVFDDVCFCLTGTFEYGLRGQVEDILKRFGAIIKNDIPKKYMCFLVVGSFVSDAWKFSTHGRKLEKAIMLREQGYNVSIVSEEHMWNELKRSGFIAR